MSKTNQVDGLSKDKFIEKQASELKRLRELSKIYDEVNLTFPFRRLQICHFLYEGNKSFRQLKDITQLSDGNLASSIRSLEEYEMIDVHKRFNGRYPLTTYSITKKGLERYKAFLYLIRSW